MCDRRSSTQRNPGRARQAGSNCRDDPHRPAGGHRHGASGESWTPPAARLRRPDACGRRPAVDPNHRSRGADGSAGAVARGSGCRLAPIARARVLSSATWRPRLATRPGTPANAGRPARTCTRRLSVCTRPCAAARSRSVRRSMRAANSVLAAMTISAAADGVGARRSATKSAIVTSVSWPTAEITGTATEHDRPRHDFLVERPQVLNRASAPADDDDVDARDVPECFQRACDLDRCPLALHTGRSDHNLGTGVAAPEHLEDVADGGAVERGDDANLAGECRQRPLPCGVEETFVLKPGSSAARRPVATHRSPAARDARRRV